jgi:hypothetical protein
LESRAWKELGREHSILPAVMSTPCSVPLPSPAWLKGTTCVSCPPLPPKAWLSPSISTDIPYPQI